MNLKDINFARILNKLSDKNYGSNTVSRRAHHAVL